MRRMIRRTVVAGAVSTALLGFAVAETRAATVLVKPGKLDHFVLTAPPSVLAAEGFIVRVEPFDASGNLITEFRGKAALFAVNISGGGEVVPAKLRSEEFAGGASVKVASRRAGTFELTVTEGEGSTPLASAKLRVLPNRLDRFVVNAPREVSAGEVFQARVIAQDAYGNTKDDLTGVLEGLRAEVQGSGTAASADKGLPPFRAGETTLTFQPRKSGTIRVFVQESRTRSAGESAGIQVNSAALDRFTIVGPKAVVAGEKFIVQILAYDAFENPVTKYQVQGGGVVLRASGTGVLAPAVVPAKEFQDGQARVTLTYTKSEALRIAAREQNREAGGESEVILVAPGDPDHFRVSTPSEAVAGEAFPAQIDALDRFENLIEDYDLRGLEVHLSTDGRGQISPATVSPAAFLRGKATVNILYNRAESFTVVAALNKDALERLIGERRRQGTAPPAPAVVPERERADATKVREEPQRAKDEPEKKRAREEALKAREDAERARENAVRAAAKTPAKPAVIPPVPPPAAPAASAATPAPLAPPPPVKSALEAKAPAPRRTEPEPAATPAKPAVKELERVVVEESKDQVLVRLATSGPVSYNASTGSSLSREWIWLELFPVHAAADVGKGIARASALVGEITVEQLEPEKVRVSLQVLPPGISYVVTQQDREVVVKVVRTE